MNRIVERKLLWYRLSVQEEPSEESAERRGWSLLALEEHLSRFVEDPSAVESLRALLSRRLGLLLHRMDDHEVLGAARSAILEGAMELAELASPPARSDSDEHHPTARAPVAADPTTWIRFVVVDDRDVRPIPRVTLRARLPGGAERSMTTDEEGAAKVTGIRPGRCDLVSDLDGARIASTWHVCGTGPAEGASSSKPGREEAPAPRLAEVTKHRVVDGETLEGLARRAGLTWEALAVFNWGTSSPERVREFLLDPDARTADISVEKVQLEGSRDRPRVLYLPRAWTQKGLATGRSHTIRARPVPGDLYLRLPIDPEDAKELEDRFTLESADGSYRQERSVKDDLIEGDGALDLLFTDLPRSGRYSLSVDPGGGRQPYCLIEGVTYEELHRPGGDAIRQATGESAFERDLAALEDELGHFDEEVPDDEASMEEGA
jgi:hypothetical protein